MRTRIWLAAMVVFVLALSGMPAVAGVPGESTGIWYLRDASNGATTSFYHGNPGDYIIFGDWDCDTIDTPGLYRQSDHDLTLQRPQRQLLARIERSNCSIQHQVLEMETTLLDGSVDLGNLAMSPRRVATPFGQRLGSADRPLLVRSEVHSNDSMLHVGSVKQRSILAVMFAERGHVVSTAHSLSACAGSVDVPTI